MHFIRYHRAAEHGGARRASDLPEGRRPAVAAITVKARCSGGSGGCWTGA